MADAADAAQGGEALGDITSAPKKAVAEQQEQQAQQQEQAEQGKEEEPAAPTDRAAEQTGAEAEAQASAKEDGVGGATGGTAIIVPYRDLHSEQQRGQHLQRFLEEMPRCVGWPCHGPSG